jgi:transcriptional regulator with GAF, ATPase, and Fis domain
MQQPTDTSQNFHAGLNESGITAMQRGAVQTANRFANPEDLIYQISDSLFETKDIKDILTILQKLLKPYFVFEESAVAVLNHAKGGFDSFLSTGNNDPHLNGTLERIMLTEDVAHADTSNRAIRCQLINSDDLEASDWGLLRPLSSVTIDQIALFCISHKNIVYGIFLFASKKNVTYTVGLFRRFDLLFYSLAFSVSKILSYRDFSDMDRYDNSRNPDCDQSIDDEFAIPSTILEQNFAGIVGSSHEMQRVFTLLGKISGSDCTVLIHGETGTGKELIASAICP